MFARVVRCWTIALQSRVWSNSPLPPIDDSPYTWLLYPFMLASCSGTKTQLHCFVHINTRYEISTPQKLHPAILSMSWPGCPHSCPLSRQKHRKENNSCCESLQSLLQPQRILPSCTFQTSQSFRRLFQRMLVLLTDWFPSILHNALPDIPHGKD